MPPLILYFIVTGAISIVAAFSLNQKLKKNLKSLFKDKNSKDLGILGMNASGKTVFLSFLQGKEYIEKPTENEDKYEKFIYKSNSGRIFKISKGVDITGKNYKRIKYDSIMQDSNVIFYFFNINLYLNDVNYLRECNSRFQSVYQNVLKNNKQLILFASHIDLIDKGTNYIDEFERRIDNKPYNSIRDLLHPINLKDKIELKKLVDQIFENK